MLGLQKVLQQHEFHQLLARYFEDLMMKQIPQIGLVKLFF